MWFDGVFCRSRARLAASATSAARATGALTSWWRGDEQLADPAVVVVVART